MKLLFVMRHAGYVRNFESTLRRLCERGHHVHLAFQGRVKYEQLDPIDIAGQLASAYPTFSSGEIPLRSDGWGLLGREVRLGLDAMRYLESDYDDAPKLRERALREAPPAILARATEGPLASPLGRRLLATWLRAVNRAIPRDPAIDAYLQEQRPDVVAVTPLIEPGSPQAEYLRSARALGIRTAHCVASWDNLTNKGVIHGPVDRVLVWNEAMKREAIAMHGIPASRVAVTGAAAFDHWFDWKPSRGRAEFCAQVGLPADRPYLLYLCSSKFVAPEEAGFVRTWVDRIRNAPSDALRSAGLLIRPHPQNAEQWRGVDLGHEGVAIWPQAGAAPVDAGSRSDYFDSMAHSAAVVGVNTTAEIEAAIVGRRVYTVLAPEFAGTQEGTLHFRHLRGDGGLVRIARDLDAHLAQLDTAVREPAADDAQCRQFVERFVRPYGLATPATPKMVEVFEALAAMGPAAPEREPFWAGTVRSRVEPRLAELEREAKALQSSKAARQADKAVRIARRQEQRRQQLAKKVGQEKERRASRASSEQEERARRLESLVLDFSTLDDDKRRRFMKGVLEWIPPDVFVDLHAATPPRKMDYDRADIFLRATTKSESFRLRACAKEPFTIQWIHERIGAGDVLYDIGANVGVYSLVAAKKPGGGARVYAFEASYASVASLCANVVLNGLADQVTPMPVALSGATAMNVFSLRDLEPGAARHALGDQAPEDGPAVYRQPVMMFRLDDLIDVFGLPQPHHIKMDVDGGELAVLEGATRTLSSPLLQSMLVEVHTSLSGAVTEALERHGLRLHEKVSVKNKAGEYVVWYGLFAREASADGDRAAGATAVRTDSVSR